MITKNDAFSLSTLLEVQRASQTDSQRHFIAFFIFSSPLETQSKRIIRTIFIWFNFVNVIFMAYAALCACRETGE